MTSLRRQLREDKATRDAARALIDADVEHVKSLVTSAEFKEQASQEVSDKSGDALKAATEAADKNKGYIAAVVGAIIVWLARQPIQALLEKLNTEQRDDAQVESDPEPVAAAEPEERA